MKLAISPCPNDTFLYEEFVRADEPLGGSVRFLDIAELNALSSQPDGPDLVKVSCAAAPKFLDDYLILPAGGAFSDAVGPLVVGNPARATPSITRSTKVGIPGRGTSAHILWRAWLDSRNLPVPDESFLRFDLLPAACAEGEIDVAVVIHESRFTFQEAGLVEVQDLGAFWFESTGLPVPLGCLLCRRDRGPDFARRSLDRIRESLRIAWSRPSPITPWIRSHAQELSPEVQTRHIETYVTPRSLDCGAEGLEALELLWDLAETHLGDPGAQRPTRMRALKETRALLLQD